MNCSFLTGRLTVEPNCQFADDGTCKSAQFGLAVKRDFVIRDGPDTDFFQCVAFRSAAKFVEGYIHKGNKVLVRGRFHNNNYEKDGQKIYGFQFVVDSIESCESSHAREEFQPVGEQSPFAGQESNESEEK